MNGFEQLCINLSNEELQHHFNEDIFLNEASDYEKDGLKGLSISYQDNADVLKLIAGKGGMHHDQHLSIHQSYTSSPGPSTSSSR